MRIGVDGGCWGNRRGYGRYLREILAALGRVDRDNEYVLFLDPPAFDAFAIPGPFRRLRVELSVPVAQAASWEGHRSLRDVLRMSVAVRREPLDLFFFPASYSYFPILSRLPVVVCFHDTIPDRDPKVHFRSWRQALLWRVKSRLAAAQARLILTVSDYSRRCLIANLKVDPARVRVVPEAASPGFRKLNVPPAGSPYLLYVGGFNPHKNVAALLRAFARVTARWPELRVVLAGDFRSDSFRGTTGALKTLAEELGIADRVEFTGWVPDEKLCRLYNGATLVVLPSLDEGFGLPALEAMACGTPVVASAGHAFDEVVADAGILVDVRSEEALAAAIESLLADPVRRRQLSERALERARQFSWDASARRLLGVFEEARNY
jgi:glycosyltransferase involved in cell wall biosynthesis